MSTGTKKQVENYVFVSSGSWSGPKFVLPMSDAATIMGVLENALNVEEVYENGRNTLYPRPEAPSFTFTLLSLQEYLALQLRDPKEGK